MSGRDPLAAFRAAPDWIWRAIIFLLALAVLLIITTRWRTWETNATRQSTDDAYLQSDLTPIAARVSGYIRDMPVQDFDHVRKGQLIAQLVDDDYRATVAQLAASVAGASAQIGTIGAQHALQDSNVEAAQAAIEAVQANIEQNRRDLARQDKLLSTGSSSTEAGEKLKTAAAQLAAQLQQAKAQLGAARHQLVVLDAQRVQAQATLAAQQAALDLARINLGYTRIVAPDDGFIGQRQFKPGQLVGVGAQITTLTPLPRIWVLANFKETQLTHMSLDAPASIAVDAFPGHSLRGHVLAFAPGAGSQFALLPPDNATGNFTKVVQRITVKIVIDDDDGLTDRLVPGMSVIARVEARERARR